MQSAHGDTDVANKEMQIIHREFINERDARINHPDSHSRLRNIDNLIDMGFNLTRFSPILMVRDTVPQTTVGTGTTTPVPTSTPWPNGRSHLHNSDPIPKRKHMHAQKLHNPFTGIIGQPESQKLTGPESGPKYLGTNDSTPTFDMKFYPGEIPFKNQGTSTSPPQHVEPVETQTTPVNTPRGTSGTQMSPPSVANTQNDNQTTRNFPPKPNAGKGGKKNTSHNIQTRSQPQPSTSNSGTNPTSAFQFRNLGTGRPHIQCSACGGYDHFRKECHQNNFCTKCRTRSHATHMCGAPLNTGSNNICVYCGSTQHTLGNCTSWPNNNREEPRSTPRDLHSHGPYQGAYTENSGLPGGNQSHTMNFRQASTENSEKDIPDRHRGYTNNRNASLSYRDYRYNQNRAGHQQPRFDKRYNKQYSPNYNHYLYQPSPPVSIAGPDLSATLIDLANIQSRSLDIMVANQKSQQDVYNELTRAKRDKANDAMFAAINTYNGINREMFEEWIDALDQACRISGCDFRTEIINKSIGAVSKVDLTSGNCLDDQLLANLFPDTPTMNQAREDLRNMRQQEKESVMVYAYRWGRALVRSSAI